MNIEARFDLIRQAAENKNIDIDISYEYGEPGYLLDDDKKAILFSNWDDFSKYPNIKNFLEEHYEIEWYNEWIVDYDDDRGICYRNSPDSYHWQPSFVWIKDGIYGCSAINEMNDKDFVQFLDEADYINNSAKAVNLNGFEARGILVTNEDARMFENHRDPEKMMEEVINIYPEGTDFYFVIDSVEQFGIEFALYALVTDDNGNILETL